MRLAGGALGVAPGARADHDYEFDKGPAKWRYLERNRWATLIRVYPAALLALLAPALLATELALLAVAAAGGWLPQKLAAWGDVVALVAAPLGERREIQATAQIGAASSRRRSRPRSARATSGGRPLAGSRRGYSRRTGGSSCACSARRSA